MTEYLALAGVSFSRLEQDLFYIVDVHRILQAAYKVFPGAKAIIKTVFSYHERFGSAHDEILKRVVLDKRSSQKDDVESFIEVIGEIAEKCESFRDIARFIPLIKKTFFDIFSDNEDMYMRPLSFYSDYRFEAEVSELPLKNKTTYSGKSKNEDKKDGDQSTKQENGSGSSVFVYDEWDNGTQDYLNDWCHIHEVSKLHTENGSVPMSSVTKDQSREIRQVFERLKPDEMKLKKDLNIGDELILSRMVDHLVEKKAGLLPEGKIYSRRYKDERDIATAILIDISGSTSDDSNGRQVLEIEKTAVLLLAEGLRVLGDEFGIFGFSGAGKEHCRYNIFKDFRDQWNTDEQSVFRACRPQGSTRIGPAIRHTVEKLKGTDHRRKLILLLTDGKPQDSDGYTSEGLYAQYDVRRACIEAKREGVAVFCLSTGNDSPGELEIMFPVKRYAVMTSLSDLPWLLAKSYIKLTL